MKVGAIVLAAGFSRRMGAAKLALPVGGQPMLARTVAQVAAAGLPLLLVTGAHEEAVLQVVPGVPHIRAARHAEGLAESLKAGLAAAPEDWTAALIVLGDMPFVAADTLRRLADCLEAGAEAVVPLDSGRQGNPAGFARHLWPKLLELEGDRGARSLLHQLKTHEIAVDDPGIHHDLDEPADLNRA